MTGFDRATLAERTAAVERHFRRVQERLPGDAQDLRPATDLSDAVILHLWQAVQATIDAAIALCVAHGLGTPASYGDAFRALAEHGHLERALADRLARAAGFRNLLVHAYADLDLTRVHAAARQGPDDLREFLRVAARLV